ncbi:type II toxin-antitoxin system HicA family toxin [Desulfolutivibrio sp.]|uniref:type II toxin-antitoxin system HicA family toxin n=1 Tax=Desulfolutivibrio sp. TaxID=2773296 RepID=UPI002F96CAC1
MNAKNRKTLLALYEQPTPCDIGWTDVEALFLSCGAEIREGRGSRVRVALRGKVAVFHRPHPSPRCGRATVRDVREFLRNAGVKP